MLWHVGFHQIPNVPEKLLVGRQFVYFREGIFKRFTANSSAITDADVTHYVKSYAAPQHLRAGMEFYRAFPANEQLNQEQQSPVDVPIVLAGGDKTFGQLLPRMAASLRQHGCTNVTTEVIQDSGHYVVAEQPTRVAALIERYALR
jgi:pimeloyl-ACP methyl ester carboxylesterase